MKIQDAKGVEFQYMFYRKQPPYLASAGWEPEAPNRNSMSVVCAVIIGSGASLLACAVLSVVI